MKRDTVNGKIAGVCAGLAHEFEIDPIILRAIFLLLFFGFGSGILLYLILWFLMPKN
jgi:phage shock protein PspC (stress-responsive transcriptional regulator)